MHKIDLRGIFVPEILFKLEIKLGELEKNEELLALIDDPTAEDWIVRWAHRNNHDVTNIEKVATGYNVTIKKDTYRDDSSDITK